MSDLVIQVENLSKYYRLGLVGTTTLKEDIQRFSAKLLGKSDPTVKIGQKENNNSDGYIWALKDIAFEVKRGQVLGIIGRNGAGKSTLLKILSRVTAPTFGECRVKGRISSLLEVGTGFHPELTGRENIFLNGAIFGMTKEDIKRKLDEIVGFAEIGKFIDTPVKRYSSGMYVRLAFAVAAHLEPDILVIDEVLAVGDAQFQKKCLGKMREAGEGGRTVLFVSHNMAAISSLCEKTIVLKSGKISFKGDVESGIDHYLSDADHVKGFADLQNKKSKLWKQYKAFSKLLNIETLNENDERQNIFKMGGCLKIKIGFEITDDRKNIEVGVFIRDNRETILGLLSSVAEGFKNIQKGINDIQVDIPEIYLMPGEYSLGIWIVHQQQVDDACENAIAIDIIASNFTGNYVDYERFKGYGNIIRSNWKIVNNE